MRKLKMAENCDTDYSSDNNAAKATRHERAKRNLSSSFENASEDGPKEKMRKMIRKSKTLPMAPFLSSVMPTIDTEASSSTGSGDKIQNEKKTKSPCKFRVIICLYNNIKFFPFIEIDSVIIEVTWFLFFFYRQSNLFFNA